MKTQMVKAKLNGSYEIILPKHRADREEYSSKKGWERKRLASIHDALVESRSNHRQEVMYYIGAEMGEMAALCQMWGAKVVLFEPNPKAWASIKSIWEANELEYPEGIIAAFASDVDQLAKNPIPNMMINVQTGWPFCADEEIVEAHGFKELDKESETYDQVKIDTIAFESRIYPTAISIDVEGSEGRVLRGAKEVLGAYHPRIWLSLHPEFMIQQYNEWARELHDWLINEFKYNYELLDYGHELHIKYY